MKHRLALPASFVLAIFGSRAVRSAVRGLATPGASLCAVRSSAFVLALLGAPLGAGADAGVVGDWKGSLDAGQAVLTIVVHVARADSGLAVALDSPDQGVFGLAGAEVVFADARLSFRIPAVGGGFTGTLAGDRMEGTWSQGGGSLPLVLERTEAAAAPARPQTPEPPFPYRVRDVTFKRPAVTLAGTLTMPEGPGPFPAVVLVSGSGPQDRDETILGHKPFLVLADHLTRAGIAVLRYDDRGVGESTGDFAAATTPDFADDALLALHWLAKQDGIDGGRVGILGHSEGGIVAPMVAAMSMRASYLVLLAGPVVPGLQLLTEQTRLVAESSGLAPELVEKVVTLNTELYDAAASDLPPPELRSRLGAIIARARQDLGPAATAVGLAPENENAMIAQLESRWFRWFLSHDPGQVLDQLDTPVLAIYGGKDIQVPAASNTAALRGVCPDAEIEVFDGLNHLMQHAATGSIAEYGTIQETMAPEVLDRITAWILARAAKDGAGGEE